MIAACKPGTLPPPSVVVLDAGEPPRRPLRYEVDAPVAARFSATWRINDAGAERPTRRLHLLLEPKGPRCLAYRVTGGDSVKQGALVFGHLVVLERGNLWIQRGFPKHDGPRDGSLMMHEAWLEGRALNALDDAWLPLPEAPVGKGARWESSRTIGRGGLEFLEKRTFTLERAVEDEIEVAVVIEADAKPQRQHWDNYVSEQLVEEHDRASGRLVLRRYAPLPTGGWKREERTRREGERGEGVAHVEQAFELTAPDE